MKALLIKLFGLNDISDVIYSAREEERKRAVREKQHSLEEQEKAIRRHYELIIQSKDTEIQLLEKTISGLTRKESEVKEIEHRSKLQIKENYRVATDLAMQIQSFTSAVNHIFGELTTISYRVEKHNKNLQR